MGWKSHSGRKVVATKIQNKLAEMWGKEHDFFPQNNDTSHEEQQNSSSEEPRGSSHSLSRGVGNRAHSLFHLSSQRTKEWTGAGH